MKKKIVILSTLLLAPALFAQTGAEPQPSQATAPGAEPPEATADHSKALTEHLKWQDEITEWRIDHLRGLRVLAEAQAAIFAHEAILEEHAAHVARHGQHIGQHEIDLHAEGVADRQEVERMHEAFQEEHQRLTERHGELQQHHDQLNERIAALRDTLDEVREAKLAALDETGEERMYGARPETREDEEAEPEETKEP